MYTYTFFIKYIHDFFITFFPLGPRQGVHALSLHECITRVLNLNQQAFDQIAQKHMHRHALVYLHGSTSARVSYHQNLV